jgi:hypothetical protein
MPCPCATRSCGRHRCPARAKGGDAHTSWCLPRATRQGLVEGFGGHAYSAPALGRWLAALVCTTKLGVSSHKVGCLHVRVQ